MRAQLQDITRFLQKIREWWISSVAWVIVLERADHLDLLERVIEGYHSCEFTKFPLCLNLRLTQVIWVEWPLGFNCLWYHFDVELCNRKEKFEFDGFNSEKCILHDDYKTTKITTIALHEVHSEPRVEWSHRLSCDRKSCPRGQLKISPTWTPHLLIWGSIAVDKEDPQAINPRH